MPDNRPDDTDDDKFSEQMWALQDQIRVLLGRADYNAAGALLGCLAAEWIVSHPPPIRDEIATALFTLISDLVAAVEEAGGREEGSLQ